MICEIMLFGTLYSIFYKLKNYKEYSIKSDFLKIVYRIGSLINRQEEIPKIEEINLKHYGYEIIVSLPWGITSEEFEKHIDAFKEGLKLESLSVESNKGIVHMHCVEKYIFNTFNPIKLKACEILIGDGLTEKVIVNLNKFPHVLIGGDTGSGKSKLLSTILTNLINNSNADLYLLQLRKNDLGVFKNCRQVKAFSTNLIDIRDSLLNIDKELQLRERLIDNTKGFYNIEDYNKAAVYKLKYNYIVIEEFSFLNISKGDNKDDKLLKYECLKYIKNIANAGRSSGVFLITSLQKPTSDSIPSDIKSQLTTRISLIIKDKPTSIVVMGDDIASTLKEREFVCRTLNTIKGYTLTITHDDVMNSIKERIIDKKPAVAPKPCEQSNVEDVLKLLNEITG